MWLVSTFNAANCLTCSGLVSNDHVNKTSLSTYSTKIKKQWGKSLLLLSPQRNSCKMESDLTPTFHNSETYNAAQVSWFGHPFRLSLSLLGIWKF